MKTVTNILKQQTEKIVEMLNNKFLDELRIIEDEKEKVYFLLPHCFTAYNMLKRTKFIALFKKKLFGLIKLYS